MEDEFVKNQERLRPTEERTERERSELDELRGTPLSVGTLEEIIDESHAIVSSSVGPEYYVSIMSYVDKDLLEPGCSVLLHNKVMTMSMGEDAGVRRTIVIFFFKCIHMFVFKFDLYNFSLSSGYGSCGNIR